MKREGRAGKGRHAERVGGRAATGRQDGAGRGLAEQPWHCAARWLARPLPRDRLWARRPLLSGHKGGRGLLSCPSRATCWGGDTRPLGYRTLSRPRQLPRQLGAEPRSHQGAKKTGRRRFQARRLLLFVFARGQGPSAPTSVFLEGSCPHSPSPMGFYYLGKPPRHSGCKQMPLSLLPSLATTFFSTLEQPAHPACPPSRGSSSGAARITRPTLSAATKFPVKLRGGCRLHFRA